MAMQKRLKRRVRMAALRIDLRKKYGGRGYVTRFAGELGVTVQTVSNWLNCRNRPSPRSARDIQAMGLGYERRF